MSLANVDAVDINYEHNQNNDKTNDNEAILLFNHNFSTIEGPIW